MEIYFNNKKQFNNFWSTTYKGIPVSNQFKLDYPSRWLRVHSLPKSKRYPDNEEEWQILLNRQNQIITSIIGNDARVLLVYQANSITDTQLPDTLQPYSFTQLDHVSPHEHDEEEIYSLAFAETVWKEGMHKQLLKEIAMDEIKIFFISIEKKILAAPYDGGIDFALENIQARDHYKQKYKDWLSLRQDGY